MDDGDDLGFLILYFKMLKKADNRNRLVQLLIIEGNIMCTNIAFFVVCSSLALSVKQEQLVKDWQNFVSRVILVIVERRVGKEINMIHF